MFTVNDVNNYLQYLARISIWGAVTKTVLSPIERTKLVLQNQNSCFQVLRGERKPYPGILSCLVRFPKEQGFLSYWRGNGTNIVRYFPTQLLNSSFNDLYRAVFPDFMKNTKYGKNQFVQNFVAGGTAASTALLFVYPLDLCQTKLAVDIGGGYTYSSTPLSKAVRVKREYWGLAHCLHKIRRADGVAGLYKGFGMCTTGAFLSRGIYVSVFETLMDAWDKHNRDRHQEKDHHPSAMLAICFAQMATCASGLIAYPCDTIGRRLMLESGRPVQYKLFNNCFQAVLKVYMEEGWRGLYSGCMSNCIRGLAGAILLVFYGDILNYEDWRELVAAPCDSC